MASQRKNGSITVRAFLERGGTFSKNEAGYKVSFGNYTA